MQRTVARSLIGFVSFVSALSSPAVGQNASYAGLWQLKSSGGYTGFVALDAIGGCSYFISSAALSIQATCIVRELGADSIMIFGTQDGTNMSGPTYGDQLNNSSQGGTNSTNISIVIENIKPQQMSGKMITTSAEENVFLTR